MRRTDSDHAVQSDRRRIFTVAELNKEIQAALQDAFPGTVWVRGEVQRLPLEPARRKHLYFELHDTSGGGAANFQIPVALLQWDRERFGLGRYLDGRDPDFQLRNELEVCLECRVDFYPPFGKLTLKVVGIDKSFTLGQLEALRRQVLAFLERERLLERNAQLPFPQLPLRVGLITAAGSAAEKDFRTGLATSPYPFQLDLIDCRMQGEQTERQVVQALQVLAQRGVDVIVITRGGGSRGDLSWFDQKGIAVAIASATVPVITAIGHEIDRSIADLVAYQACKTPTAAAEFLVARLQAAADRLQQAEMALRDEVEDILAAARQRLQRTAVRLELQVSRKVQRAGQHLSQQRTRLITRTDGHLLAARLAHVQHLHALVHSSRRCRDLARRDLNRLTPRLAPARVLGQTLRQRQRLQRGAASLRRLLPALLAGAERRLAHLAGQARLLDPERLLARGYTLTLDAAGNLVKSARQVVPGQRLHTRISDGGIESIVDRVVGSTADAGKNPRGNTAGDKTAARASGRKRRGKGDKSGGKKAHPGQKSLFR